MPELLRLFIAVELPQDVLQHLARAAALLQRHGVTGIRWVRPEGVHLTLKFLGNVPEGQAASIAQAVEAATKGAAPIHLCVQGAGVFPNMRSPRVLWLGIQGEMEHLNRLQARVEEAMERLGFARENRAFSPHLTLGRVKGRLSPHELHAVQQALDAMPDLGATELLVREVSLMQSLLGPGGAAYIRKAQTPLLGTLANRKGS